MKLASIVAAITLATAGCSDPQPDKPAAPPPALVARVVPPPAPAPAADPATPPPAAAAPVDVSERPLPADFPPECVVYAALIDKLKACDKLGGARDGLMVGYTGLRSAWSQLPADQRAGIGAQCRTQADSLRNAAAATCSL